MNAGSAHGLRPIGTEALLTCRLEKGHILPGIDTDGNTTLFEANLGWLWDRSNEDMVGGPMLRLLEGQPLRLSVVGFIMDSGSFEGRFSGH